LPRILDLDLSGLRLALRLAAAVVVGGFLFLVLYFIPSNLSAVIGTIGSRLSIMLPVNEISPLLQGLVPSILPAIGLLIAVLVGLRIVFGKTLIEGPLVSTVGLVTLVYVYISFQGGTLRFAIPQGLVPGVSGAVSLTFTIIMVLFLAAAGLTVVKGILLTKEHRARRREIRVSPSI
jgi:hypothetical protein